MNTTTPSPGPAFLRQEASIAMRVIVIALAFLLLLWMTLQITVIAVAVFLAFAQAAMLWPVVEWLSRWLPRGLAAMVAVLVYAATIGALGWFIVVQIANAWPELSEALVGSLEAANNWLKERGWSLDVSLIERAQSELEERAGDLVSGIGGAAMTTLSALGNGATILAVSLFATLFTLIGGKKMVEGIVGAVPSERRPSAFAAIRDAASTGRWWMFASAVTGAVDGLLIGLGMWALGVPLAVPIGVATFILGFIPMIGATVAGAIAVAVALFFGGVSTALWTLVLVIAVQQIEGNVLAPVLLSRAMSFPPLLTLLLSTAGGIAIGLPGLFLAVPVAGILTAMVKGWRRELPESVKAARGIEEAPPPSFEEMKAMVPSRIEHIEAAEEEHGEAADEPVPASGKDDVAHGTAPADRTIRLRGRGPSGEHTRPVQGPESE